MRYQITQKRSRRAVTSLCAVFDSAARRLLTVCAVQMRQIMARVNFSHCSLHVNGKLPRAASTPQLLHPPTPPPPLPPPNAGDSPHQLSTGEWSRADSTSASPPSPLAGHPHTQTLCKEPPVCLKFSMCMGECEAVCVCVCLCACSCALPEYKCARWLRAERNV